MKVYRFESKADGMGPYRVREGASDEFSMFWYNLATKHDNSLHPAPYEVGYDLVENEVCGCDSLRNLLNWFDGFVSDLFAVGFHIVEYEMLPSEVVCSEYGQVFFDNELCYDSEVFADSLDTLEKM